MRLLIAAILLLNLQDTRARETGTFRPSDLVRNQDIPFGSIRARVP